MNCRLLSKSLTLNADSEFWDQPCERRASETRVLVVVFACLFLFIFSVKSKVKSTTLPHVHDVLVFWCSQALPSLKSILISEGRK